MPLLMLALIALVASPATMAQEPNVMSVDEVLKHHDVLDGKLIRVRGWLTLCESLSCQISAKPSKKSPYLSIGSSNAFDENAARLVGTVVVVEAVLDTRCLRSRIGANRAKEEMVICLDRADELQNPQFIRLQ